MLVIEHIVKACRKHFFPVVFNLQRKDFANFIITGDVMSKAMNLNEVKVLHWFDDFWLYIEIRFLRTDQAFSQPTISISVFEGKEDDDIKTHLFRAEWDHYSNNTKHPQPHWHIYPHRYSREVYEDFEALMELKSEDGFEVQLAKTGLVDIRKIHFAMEASWTNKQGHVHKVQDEASLVTWMDKILEHIKDQLEYVKNGEAR